MLLLTNASKLMVRSPATAVHQPALKVVTTSPSSRPDLFRMDERMLPFGVAAALHNVAMVT